MAPLWIPGWILQRASVRPMRLRLLILFYALLLLLLPYLLVELLGAPQNGDWRLWQPFALGPVGVSPDGFLVLLATLAGALGGAVHGAGSLTQHLARRDWRREWLAWYLFRPLLGSGLAVLVYFALRGGFVPAGATGEVSPYGVGALAGLAGLFTWHVTRKLRDVLDAAFGTGGDGQAGNGGEPPRIEEARLDAGEGSAPPALRLRGERFPADSIVRVLGRELEPVEVSPGSIVCPLGQELAAELAGRGEVEVELTRKGAGRRAALARAALRPPESLGQDL